MRLTFQSFLDLGDIEDRLVFGGSDFFIVKVWDLLPRHRNYPGGSYDVFKPNDRPAVRGSYSDVEDRTIDTFYLHQSGGSVTHKGLEAVFSMAEFFIRDPSWDGDGRWTGRGRGWPFFGYTYFVPWVPDVYRGKMIVYQTNPLSRVSWHSGDNRRSVSLVGQGYFKSKHIRSFLPRKGQTGSPSKAQMALFKSFVHEYVLGELVIDASRVYGHADSPKPKKACPGDDLERFCYDVRRHGGYKMLDAPQLTSVPHMIELGSWEERQAALVLLGSFIGTYGPKSNGVDGDPGELTRLAIEAQEAALGLPVDGYWDDTFDHIIKLTLMACGKNEQDIAELI